VCVFGSACVGEAASWCHPFTVSSAQCSRKTRHSTSHERSSALCSQYIALIVSALHYMSINYVSMSLIITNSNESIKFFGK